MRTSGVLDAVQGLGLHDHVCWPFDTQADFIARAREFLTDGLAAGQEAWYIAEGPVEELTTHLSGLEDALTSGALKVVSLNDAYQERAVEPHVQAAAYAVATEDALAAGYTGLRVAAEATPLVRGDAALDAFCRYEHLVDRYMTAKPFAAMCAYDRRVLTDDEIGHLACLHPASGAGGAQFRLFATEDGVGLEGEIDLDSRERFPLALHRAGLGRNGQVLVEAPDLDFIDHHGLYALSDLGDVVLRTPLSTARRLVDLLDMPGVRVVR
ncbi:MEDS domain-containing protein [Actinosynnema sp. NPDC020468]|uniref:MEDS domain-containing protein n=1 Tax=Actinosynnema sp. NPDC020468 TaxID=3154488 RepID=UPI0033D915FC